MKRSKPKEAITQMEKYTVLKNFMNLLAGDEIEFSNDCDDRIFLTVRNRKKFVKFYGNENGRWGKGNPAPRNGRNFMLIEENVGSIRVMIFDKLPPRKPDINTAFGYEGRADRVQEYKEKIINDFKTIGVF